MPARSRLAIPSGTNPPCDPRQMPQHSAREHALPGAPPALSLEPICGGRRTTRPFRARPRWGPPAHPQDSAGNTALRRGPASPPHGEALRVVAGTTRLPGAPSPWTPRLSRILSREHAPAARLPGG